MIEFFTVEDFISFAEAQKCNDFFMATVVRSYQTGDKTEQEVCLNLTGLINSDTNTGIISYILPIGILDDTTKVKIEAALEGHKDSICRRISESNENAKFYEGICK